MLKRAGSLLFLLLVAHVILAGAAGADTVDVIVDSADVTLTEADDGSHTAKVTIVNTTDADIPVGWKKGKADPGCKVKRDPKLLDAGSSTSVTLTLTRGCDVGSGKDILLTFDGATPSEKTITADPPADTTPDWTILAWSLGVAFVLMLLVDIWVLIRIDEINRENTPLQGPPTAPVIIGPGTPLSGLGTSWSFKESWVSNVTLGASALIALFAASDILTSVVGEKPRAAIGLMAVAAGISAVCVTIGPLVLKAIGGEVTVPTAAGTVVAASLVLFGSFTQIAAVTIQASALVNRQWLEVVLGAVGLAIALIVGWYAGSALGGSMKTGAKRDPEPPSPQEKAAQMIADAINPPPAGFAPPPPTAQFWTPPTSKSVVL